eukprot:m.88866 g.88866  ORF g.88866 m.88866 type:complete len:222 (+) comp11682_c1_seq1:458-1123(+)
MSHCRLAALLMRTCVMMSSMFWVATWWLGFSGYPRVGSVATLIALGMTHSLLLFPGSDASRDGDAGAVTVTKQLTEMGRAVILLQDAVGRTANAVHIGNSYFITCTHVISRLDIRTLSFRLLAKDGTHHWILPPGESEDRLWFTYDNQKNKKLPADLAMFRLGVQNEYRRRDFNDWEITEKSTLSRCSLPCMINFFERGPLPSAVLAGGKFDPMQRVRSTS